MRWRYRLDPTPRRTPAELPGGTFGRSVRLLGRSLRDEPLIFTLAIAGSAVYGLTTVLAGWLLGRATDNVVQPAILGDSVSTADIWWAGGSIALVGAVNAIAVVIRRVFAGMAVYNLQSTTRAQVVRQYTRLPMSWLRRHPAGQLLSNANADVEAAFMALMPLPFALGVIVMLVAALIAMVLADPFIALAGMIVLPLILVVNTIFERAMSPRVTAAQQLRAEVAEVAHESFDAAMVVKSLGREDAEERRFAAVSDELRDRNVEAGRVRSVFDPIIEMLPVVGSLAVLGVGAWRVSTGEAGTGDVVTAAFLLTLMAFPIRAIGFVLGDLPRSLVGWDRVARVLDAPPGPAPGTVVLPRGEAEGVTIDFDHVGYGVGGGDHSSRILEDLTGRIEPGRTVAIVGPTGSGKSTLASLLLRLDQPTDGTIRYDDIDLADLDPTSLATTAALVSQSTFLFGDTVRANIVLGLTDDEPDDDAIWSALTAAHVADVVRALPGGLDEIIGERGASLSGGQRQRLAIARALVRHPRLLVLDDATSAVDPEVERAILSTLTGDGPAGRPTVLVVAYRMATITMADEVIHLDDGRIVDRGSHSDLLRRDPGYRDLALAYERDADRRRTEEP